MNLTAKILLIVFIPFYSGIAQNDSDNTVLENVENVAEEQRIELLTQLVWKNRSKNPDKAIQYGLEAIELAHKYNRLSDVAKTNNFLGIVYRNTGMYLEAINYYSKALSIAQTIDDTVQIAYAYNNLGGIYRLQGKYPEAVEKILQALQVFENLGDEAGAAFCTINIGICYRNLGNYELALEYFYKTINTRKKIRDEFGLALAYNHIAEVYFEQADFNTAMKYYEQALITYEKLNDQKGIASIYGGMGGIYYEKGNFDKALECRNKSLDINKRIKNSDGIIVDQNNMGLIYSKIGQPEKGVKLLNSSLELAKQMDAGNRILETYRYLSDFFDERKDYKKALEYYKKYNEKNEEFFNKEKQSRIAELETQYNTERQIKENEYLKRNLEIEKKLTEYLTAFVFVILLIVIVLYLQFRSKKKLNKKLNALLASRNKFFYIIAHDLKSPFNSLKGYSYLLKENFYDFSDEEKRSAINDISEVTDKVYNLVENLLDWSRFQTGSIDIKYQNLNLDEVVKNNCTLFQQSAKIKNISINCTQGNEAIVKADEYMLNVIIRNLLNNAIKFSNPGNAVNIDYITGNKFARITVEDFGVGMSEDELNKLFRIDVNFTNTGTNKERGTGLGLILSKEFVQKMGGEITVTSKKNIGSKFTFTVPLAP